MQNKFFKSIAFLALVSIIFTMSCKKKIDDAYLNPNAAVIQPVESILSGVIGSFTAFFSSAGTGYGLQADAILLGRYIQYWGSQSSGELYGVMGSPLGTTSDATGSVWAAVYYGQGQNVNRIIDWGTEQQKWDYVGVAWAVRAWGWLELTDEYSDAILKEAFNTSLQQFHYDTQPEFYDSCRAVCFRSLEFLNRTDGNVSQANLAIGDAFFYNGDVSKWKKFVYGILARSYINLSSKDIFKANNYAYADSAIKYASLSLANNGDNALVKVAGGLTSAVNNYFGPFRGNIGTIRQSQFIADLMSGANTAFPVSDPRRWYMLRENLNNTFKGFVPYLGSTGLSGSDYPKNYWGNPLPTSTAGPTIDSSRYVYQNTSPWPIMTASEMQFIVAEAELRKGTAVSKQNALNAYRKAIDMNFDMLTTTYPQNIPAGKEITQPVKTAFVNNTSVVPASSNQLTLTHIMLQKYIALYAWGVQETWVDMRKFHYTDIDPATNSPVYAGFTPPPSNFLLSTNNGKYVYRCRPRYNSEYLYDVPELTRIGAYQNLDYNTYEMWFSMK